MRAHICVLALLLASTAAPRALSNRVLKAKNPGEVAELGFGNSLADYTALVDSKPYADFVEVKNRWVCYYHYFNVVKKYCGDDREDALCCKAIESMLNADEGNCLCDHLVMLDSAVITPVLELVGTLKCQVKFPIPQVEPALFPMAIRKLEECEGNSYPELRSDFLGISDEELLATDAEDLPKYRDIFEPLPGGKYETSYTVVNITRPTPSILENQFSTPDEFSAIVVYPSNRDMEEYDPVTGESISPAISKGTEEFPIVTFSPGFQARPELQLLLLGHLASFGMVAVSQRSTSPIAASADPRLIKAWAQDVALGLDYLAQAAKDDESFLYGRLDTSRAAVGGHSFGAIAVFPAAVIAPDFGVTIKAVVQMEPTCVPFGNICDEAAEANMQELKDAKYLILAGQLDGLGLPSHARFFANLPALNDSDVSLVLLKGVTHCVGDLDPMFWQFAGDCGTGYLTPMEQARRVQKTISNFLIDALQLG